MTDPVGAVETDLAGLLLSHPQGEPESRIRIPDGPAQEASGSAAGPIPAVTGKPRMDDLPVTDRDPSSGEAPPVCVAGRSAHGGQVAQERPPIPGEGRTARLFG